MQNAVLVIHLMVAVALVTVVLFQQSEGGALGMGGGGGAGGGFLSGRGTANLLTRVTAGLALAFFCTSVLLTILANRGRAPASVLQPLNTRTNSAPAVPGSPANTSGKPAVPTGGGGGVLDALKAGRGNDRLPRVPQGQ